MTRVKAVLLGSLAMLALLLAFGCSLLPRGDDGTGDGWYIKLQIQAPAAAKGITVTDFDVTGLKIQVRDPEGEVLQTIDWAADESSKTYLVPVKQMGVHEIEVTHLGERDGEEVEATEKAAFNIQAMVITVIDIVPGCIGVIRVEGETPAGGGTISGRVYDWITGAGVSGATVVFGDYSTTAGASGAYSITVPTSVSSVEGVFAAFKGLDYRFLLCGSIAIDPTPDPVFNIGLPPHNNTGYAKKTLSGKIYDDTGAEIGDGNVQLRIFNENRGQSLCEAEYVRGVGYSVSTKTFGSGCFVQVEVENQFQFYLKDQDLATDRANYDLHQPVTGFTTVTLNGIPGSGVDGFLVVPDYGWAGIAGGDLDSASQTTLKIYNPDEYPMCWRTQTDADGTPGPGTVTVRLNALTMPFSGMIYLPAPYDHDAPSATVDGTTASWNEPTLAWDEVPGANGYMTHLMNESGYYGYVLMNSSSIAFPDEFADDVLNADAEQGWDIMAWPIWSPQCEADAILDFSLRLWAGGPPLGDYQLAIVQSWDELIVDIIP